MDRLRIGILFGGNSREREVSFAGGRTVYDNLNKALFEPVPLFVDSFGNLLRLRWEFIYKGSIRDFYPPVGELPVSPNGFQVYAESLPFTGAAGAERLTHSLGSVVPPAELCGLIDFAFLCLHGTNGEDGRIQGLLEYLRIPYSGSGILPSAFGMNKVVQKQMMEAAGFACPRHAAIRRSDWMQEKNKAGIIAALRRDVGLPCVIKAANQGSSIGVSVIQQDSDEGILAAVDTAFFIRRLQPEEWKRRTLPERVELVRTLCDIREGIGVPLLAGVAGTAPVQLHHPEAVLQFLDQHLEDAGSGILLQGCDAESEVIAEAFIEGREFSCIVIRNEDGKAVALPPTEIRKGREVFDYRSKYLPGLSRKITPIQLPYTDIQRIRKECERLFDTFRFNVYARIDGFFGPGGQLFLNDPNTTSGMMPSSFFFHQAAEIGLNPSQFLTYIIRTSLAERISDFKDLVGLPALLERLDQDLAALKGAGKEKIRVAVILGGYSSERHISVESGRNIYEKLSSSEKYDPVPVFLSGDATRFRLFQIPVSLLLKDNADDIREKTEHFSMHEVTGEIIHQCADITSRYTSARNVLEPVEMRIEQLAGLVDFAFIALHGRPGEDGAIQRSLEAAGLPYNGSGVNASGITINKYETNELLMRHGFHVARHRLVDEAEWHKNKEALLQNIFGEFTFPFIAKPVDDGCSSAVKKIRSREELEAFASLIFREEEELISGPAAVLQLKMKEEFPRKRQFLIEELVQKGDAAHFLEITGGLLTHFNDRGERIYEMFEASEALSEGDVLSLEEKFLAGQGQNITPARYAADPTVRDTISGRVKEELMRVAKLLDIEGYARIDAFVRIFANGEVEVIIIEVNSLPGMTPATCIFHQSAINGYKPYEFIDGIIDYGMRKRGQGEKVN
jgi:UDP-N-acetylmuramate--alanine ligase